MASISQSSAVDRRLFTPSAEAPAPVTGWRRLAVDMAAVSSSSIACQAIGVLNSLVLRAALTPAQMGVWQGLKLLLGYANYTNLGVSKGAARELAIAVGSGNEAHARRALNLAFTVNTTTSVLYGIGLATAGFFLLGERPVSSADGWLVGLLALGILVVVQRHLTFQITILRCKQSFALTSWAAVVEGTLSLGLAGLGAWRWGLPGLYAGTLLTLLASLAYLRWQGVSPLAFAWDWSEIKRLVAIGGPILLGGVAAALMQSLDKLMILTFSSDREFELGCYSTPLLITGQIYGLANMFAMVIAPRFGELYGRTGSRAAVAGLTARASELLAAVTSLCAAAGLVIAAPLLSSLFPAYRAGMPSARWLVPGIAMLAISLPLNQYLVAVCRERLAMAAAVAALVLGAFSDYATIKLGGGMQGVAAATATIYAAYYLLLLAVSILPELDRTARHRYLATHTALLACPLTAALWLSDVRADILDAPEVIKNMSVVFAAWGSIAAIGWRCGDWRSAWSAGEIANRELANGGRRPLIPNPEPPTPK